MQTSIGRREFHTKDQNRWPKFDFLLKSGLGILIPFISRISSNLDQFHSSAKTNTFEAPRMPKRDDKTRKSKTTANKLRRPEFPYQTRRRYQDDRAANSRDANRRVIFTFPNPTDGSTIA